MRTCLILALVLAAPVAAADVPELRDLRAVVVGRVDGGVWTDAPTEARADQRAELGVVVVGRRGKQRVVLVPEGIGEITLGRRAVTKRELGRLHATSVRWSTIEPHGFRAQPAANGATSEFYSNVSTEPGTFGKWLGYDAIDYVEHPRSGQTAPIIPATVAPADPTIVQVAGLGTLRYKVEVELASGGRVASPGAEAVDTFGIKPSVHRVSIRGSDDFLGWLGAYLLVPEVFGSAGPGRNHQTERFVGADCADVMVGAARRAGHRLAYTNVAGLTSAARPIVAATLLDDHGLPATEITGVRPGDLIRIDYGGALRGHTPRGWDHVAALWEDRSDPTGPMRGAADGKLDGFDLVIHIGHPRLVIEPLARQAPATVDVLRWRTKK